MRIERLTGTLGAQVHEVDLRDERAPWETLRRAWLEHKVLFFRGQVLTPAEQVALARRFGTPTPAHPLLPGHPMASEVLVLDSARYELGVGRRAGQTSYNNAWHTDVTFAQAPPARSVLHAIEVPERGGDTVWADLGVALASLSPGLRALVRTLEATHTAHGVFGTTVRADQQARDAHLARLPAVTHPVVRVHPETGEEGLFVNPTFTAQINDVSPAESRALLDLLNTWIPSPDWSVRWRWQRGDVAIWDNRITSHFATADYGDARRIMHRVTIAGDTPLGPLHHASAQTTHAAPPEHNVPQNTPAVV